MSKDAPSPPASAPPSAPVRARMDSLTAGEMSESVIEDIAALIERTAAPADPSEARDLRQLTAALAEGAEAELLFFWGHRPLADGRVGKSCLSQWYAAPFTVDGERYATAEHWMMAEKARLFGDAAARAKILAAREPGEAKKLGRGVRGFDVARWAEARFEIVVRGNVEKFGQNAELKAFLLGTGDQVLVEASPEDRIWGIGMAADDPRARHPDEWDGENLLGFALMEARARLRA
jgi:ribA/ribD-fused uncharacterized protein